MITWRFSFIFFYSRLSFLSNFPNSHEGKQKYHETKWSWKCWKAFFSFSIIHWFFQFCEYKKYNTMSINTHSVFSSYRHKRKKDEERKNLVRHFHRPLVEIIAWRGAGALVKLISTSEQCNRITKSHSVPKIEASEIVHFVVMKIITPRDRSLNFWHSFISPEVTDHAKQ